jgi:hypothetical protein
VNRPPPDLGTRYAYVALFVVLTTIYALVVGFAIGMNSDGRRSIAAFVAVPISLVLLGFAALARQFEGRIALIIATAAFGFVPAIGIAAWQRIERPIVFPAIPEPDGSGLLPLFIAVGLLAGFAGAAPHVVRVEVTLDRIARFVAPLLLVAEVAMFGVAIAHARRPDPDTFIATLPAPQVITPHGPPVAIGGRTLTYTQVAREGCQVHDQKIAAYTDSWGCEEAKATFDAETDLVMVHKKPTWSSTKALRPSDIAPRLAAPVGWTHLAGGGALLAGIALVLAAAFARRARTIEDPKERPPGGYRVPAETPDTDDGPARLRDAYEARARGARVAALTVVAWTSLPLAAALAHGLGR